MRHALRYELLKAQKNVAGQTPLLNLEGAEVEVKFVVKKGVKGEAGIGVHFVAVETRRKVRTGRSAYPDNGRRDKSATRPGF